MYLHGTKINLSIAPDYVGPTRDDLMFIWKYVGFFRDESSLVHIREHESV